MALDILTFTFDYVDPLQENPVFRYVSCGGANNVIIGFNVDDADAEYGRLLSLGENAEQTYYPYLGGAVVSVQRSGREYTKFSQLSKKLIEVLKVIQNYHDFITALLNAGFSVASGGNNEGVFGLIEHGWDEEPSGSAIRWHTGNPETDPWEWRMRVLDERNDIAYAKVFFRKAGYITKEWYPYFLAARRAGKTFDEEYADGTISHFAKRIYDVVTESGILPLHEIKQLAEFTREEKSKFDGALTDLQMKLYLTMCGGQQKISQKGEEYGWSSTVFCTTERFFGEDVFEKAAKLNVNETVNKITNQILKLNPSAQEKKIIKFIKG